MGGFVRNITGQTAARRAAEAGAGQQLELSQSAEAQAREDLQSQFDPSLAAITGGFDRAGDILRGSRFGIEGALKGGASSAENALTVGTGQARDDIGVGFGQARGDISQAALEAQQQLQGFSDIGNEAAQREAALSGALGNEAQQAAFQSFNESPGQAFLREQGEKAALRGAASQGRSLGGGILAELQRRGTGLAQQDFGNQMARLASIAGRGQQASGGIADIISNRGANLAGMSTQEAQLLANLAGQQGSNLANIRTGLGSQLAGVRGNLASNLANLETGGAQQEMALRQGLGTGLANITTGQAAQQAGIIGNRTSNIGNAALAGGNTLFGLVGAGLGAAGQAASGGA